MADNKKLLLNITDAIKQSEQYLTGHQSDPLITSILNQLRFIESDVSQKNIDVNEDDRKKIILGLQAVREVRGIRFF